MLCCVMLCYVILCYVMLIILYYIIVYILLCYIFYIIICTYFLLRSETCRCKLLKKKIDTFLVAYNLLLCPVPLVSICPVCSLVFSPLTPHSYCCRLCIGGQHHYNDFHSRCGILLSPQRPGSVARWPVTDRYVENKTLHISWLQT